MSMFGAAVVLFPCTTGLGTAGDEDVVALGVGALAVACKAFNVRSIAAMSRFGMSFDCVAHFNRERSRSADNCCLNSALPPRTAASSLVRLTRASSGGPLSNWTHVVFVKQSSCRASILKYDAMGQ